MKYGIIYKITNRTNGKVYIGKTVQAFTERVKSHKYKSCRAFNNAIISHGWNAFDKEEFICALDESYLPGLEEKAIKAHDCIAPKGYNLIEFDNGLTRYSNDSKKKMSDSRKQYWIENKETSTMTFNKKEHLFIENVEHKNCSRCKTNKLLTEYYGDKNRWDNLMSHCKVCQNSLNKAYQNSNKLTPEETAKSYVDRKTAMSVGQKRAFQENPELKYNLSKLKSKIIIATNLSSGIETEYESGLICKQQTGMCNKQISRAIKTGKSFSGHMWRFK